MNVTGKDIAKLLGVSPSTISMVINNKPGISTEKRNEIIAKIKELKYDYLLKSETDQKVSTSIAFVIFRREGAILGESPFISLLVEPVSMQLQKYGYNMVLTYVEKDTAVTKMKELVESGCSGFILDAVEMQEDDIALFDHCTIPYVVFNNNFVNRDTDTVCIHNEQGVYKALSYLTGMGHTRFGYIRSRSPIRSFNERLEALRSYSKKFNLKFEESCIFTLPYSQVGAYDEMGKKLDKFKAENKSLPTAFFADNDIICYPAMRAFQEKGYSIPDDISVVGFDDRPLCITSVPQITTLRIPRYTFGASAVDLLVRRIRNPELKPVTVQTGVELIIRSSTGPAPQKDTPVL
jgi:DNA-binding LacI/PurR family transcriptional regulator